MPGGLPGWFWLRLRLATQLTEHSDDRGILGLDDSVPAGPLSVSVRVVFGQPSANPAQLEALARWAVDHCPVTDSVRRAVPLSVEVIAGG
jgi:organic hydroperoxide reductase OsmC/OhrA